MSEQEQIEEIADGDEVSDRDDDGGDSISSDVSVEPSCNSANNIAFGLICSRMENLFQQQAKKKNQKKKVTQKEKYECIMPSRLIQAIKAQSESLFPLLRLYCPDLDTARSYGMKEGNIVNAYCDALSLAKTSRTAEMLKNFSDPQKVPTGLAGNLSLVVEHVMKERRNLPLSRCRLVDINNLLDELAGLQKKQHHHNHRWREGSQDNQPQKKLSANEMRAKWLKKVIDIKQLSPLEHKWLVRIIMKKPEFGMRSNTILQAYSKYALEIFAANNSLKSLCSKLASPEYERNRRLQEEEEKRASQGLDSRWDPQTQPVVLGNVCTPMLSSKLTFEKAMTQIAANHTDYLKSAPAKECLALKFPLICAETKLDGERMIIHVKDGKVTMHTRNGNWYSNLYSSVLGPAIRRALQNYSVDAIFDGEVMSWDNRKEELVPFGYNRTIANYRRAYLERQGLVEEIDTKFHGEGSTDAKVMTNDDDWANKPLGDDESDGKDCWLFFCVFDLLYLGGKDATRFLQNDCGLKDQQPGSIIHLSCLERKQVLQKLLVEQEHEIEICKSVVIRPNGECVPGDEYFGQKVMEHGYERTVLDSTDAALKGLISSSAEIDAKQQGYLSLKEISGKRAQAIEDFFRTVVEHHKKEGIVVKDLAAPYILGEPSRRRKYWHKFKPDYERATGNAVDIDVVILGGYYASGLRNSGKISSFLCGCRDQAYETPQYMTFCNINGASAGFDRLARLLAHTGFKAKTKDSEMELGNWQPSSDFEGDLPAFISSRSLQRGTEDFDGWKYNKSKNYPDLWIEPENSVVLTIEGQELIVTDEYSAGVCLRFPKIIKIRLDEMDGAKPAEEVESVQDLWDTYYTTIRQREHSSRSNEFSQFSQSLTVPDGSALPRRFLTPEEFQSNTKKRKRKEKPLPSSKVPKVQDPKTKILSGYTFVVLDGKYSLDPESLDAKAAKEEGWYELAESCKKKEHVMEFILTHGGTVKILPEIGDKLILGGKETDLRVVQHMKSINIAREQLQTATTKSKKTEDLMKMAESEGILKWSFVYSIVHRWINDRKDRNENQGDLPSIKEVDGSFLLPKVHHYLARDALKEVDSILDIFDLDTSNLMETDFERALHEIANRSDGDFDTPWQDKSFWYGLLDESHDMQQTFEKIFWPVDWGISGKDQVILYPHVFGEVPLGQFNPNEGFEHWDELEKEGKLGDASTESILSTLPLARGMGALVSSSFNEQVTHIICDLKDGIAGVISTSDEGGIGQEILKDEAKWKCLLPHLKSVVDAGRDVKFVSPAWIRIQWDRHFCSTV